MRARTRGSVRLIAIAAALSASQGRLLASLNLRENRLGNAGAIALAGAACLGRLAFLNLGENKVGPAGARALVMGTGAAPVAPTVDTADRAAPDEPPGPVVGGNGRPQGRYRNQLVMNSSRSAAV